jgi:hypothetical protein
MLRIALRTAGTSLSGEIKVRDADLISYRWADVNSDSADRLLSGKMAAGRDVP